MTRPPTRAAFSVNLKKTGMFSGKIVIFFLVWGLISGGKYDRAEERRETMSWIGWIIIGILAVNGILFGIMGAVFYLERRRNR